MILIMNIILGMSLLLCVVIPLFTLNDKRKKNK